VEVIARMRFRFDRFEIFRHVVPGNRIAVVYLEVSRESIEAVFRDIQEPVNVDRIIGSVGATPDVFVALAGMLE
jgi:hypothetical protein